MVLRLRLVQWPLEVLALVVPELHRSLEVEHVCGLFAPVDVELGAILRAENLGASSLLLAKALLSTSHRHLSQVVGTQLEEQS